MSAKKKWIRRVLLGVLALYALYLLAAHVFLATPLLRHLANKNPQKFELQYSSAWTVVPGRVHVRGLRLRFRDSIAETYISADRLAATFNLFALTKRTIRAHDVQTSGVSVRVRPRIYRDQLTPLTLEGVAEIPGFEGPPFKSEEPRELPKFDKMWTLDVTGLTIDPLRELWIGPYRFAGDAKTVGGFYVKPLQQFELYPSRMEVRSGELFLAKRPFTGEIHGSIEATIVRHDPRAVDGTEMLRHVSGRVDLVSAVADLGFAQRWLIPATEVHLTGGYGSMESHARVEHGVVQDGTSLVMKSERVLLRRAPFTAWLDGRMELHVEKNVMHGQLALTKVRFMRRYAESYPLLSDEVDMIATSRSLDLARKPFDDVLVSLDVPRATITDLRMLTGLLGKEADLTGGVAHLKGHFDLSVRESLMQGEASFDSPKLSAYVQKVAFAAHVAMGLRFKQLDLSTMTGSVPHAYLDIREAALAGPSKAPPPSWWGRVDLSHGTLDAAQKPMFAGDLASKARDARPIIYLATANNPLPGWAREPLAMEGLTLFGKLHVGPGVAIENLNGEGGSIDVKGRLEKKNKATSGFITLSYGPFALTINLVPRNKPVGGGPKSQ